ncbi:MAG: aminoglycoside phosphotransferase family protein [Hyphomicrobiales bacterium]
MSDFHINTAKFIEQTALATISKVQLRNGRYAALKHYDGGDMRNERTGFDWMLAHEGVRCAKLLDVKGSAVLIEWLEGPSLGDLVREGDDVKASTLLASVAQELHSNATNPPSNAPLLTDWFIELHQTEIVASCPQAMKEHFTKAQQIARNLIDTQRDIVWLHGDLHHDNIRRGARGWCAFDAKGVVGERAYELANAFRNPKGVAELVRDQARINRLADMWSEALQIYRKRLLQWAAAKCALSIAWRATGALDDDPEFDLLALLINAAEA